MSAILFGYMLLALLVGIVTGSESVESPRFADAGPAVGVLAGGLWPVTLLAVLVWCCLRGGIGLARSFAALWYVTVGAALYRRAARVKLPRARKVRR